MPSGWCPNEPLAAVKPWWFLLEARHGLQPLLRGAFVWCLLAWSPPQALPRCPRGHHHWPRPWSARGCPSAPAASTATVGAALLCPPALTSRGLGLPARCRGVSVQLLLDTPGFVQGGKGTAWWVWSVMCYLREQNARLNEAQAGIEFTGRSTNNLRSADNTTLSPESKEEPECLLMKVKEESEKAGLKFSKFKKRRSWHRVPSLHGK